MKRLRHHMLSAGLLLGTAACTAAPAKLILLTGQNNHDWQTATPLLVAMLQQTGRFEVKVLTTPPATATPDEQNAFAPDFSNCDAVVLNWNNFGVNNAPTLPWTDKLLAFVENGGGLVLHHAAGIDSRPDFGNVAGLVWQSPAYGDRITLDDEGKTVRVAKGEGPGSGHGARFEFPLKMWSRNHPICAGLPAVWLHTEDEAWFAQRGPAQGMTVLATTVAPETKQNEPMIWIRNQGKGRVFVCRLGHDAKAMACIGFRTVFARGCEWAATGKVTLPVPANFPTASKTSSAAP